MYQNQRNTKVDWFHKQLRRGEGDEGSANMYAQVFDMYADVPGFQMTNRSGLATGLHDVARIAAEIDARAERYTVKAVQKAWASAIADLNFAHSDLVGAGGQFDGVFGDIPCLGLAMEFALGSSKSLPPMTFTFSMTSASQAGDAASPATNVTVSTGPLKAASDRASLTLVLLGAQTFRGVRRFCPGVIRDVYATGVATAGPKVTFSSGPNADFPAITYWPLVPGEAHCDTILSEADFWFDWTDRRGIVGAQAYEKAFGKPAPL